jgi:hypothetical protein
MTTPHADPAQADADADPEVDAEVIADLDEEDGDDVRGGVNCTNSHGP